MKDDVVWESEHEWRTIDKCRFVRCEIPVSVLLSIEDSVFEDCRFVKDDDSATDAVLSGTNKSLHKTVHFIGIRGPEIPSPSQKLTFQTKPATSTMEKRGCPPFYNIEAGELEFR